MNEEINSVNQQRRTWINKNIIENKHNNIETKHTQTPFNQLKACIENYWISVFLFEQRKKQLQFHVFCVLYTAYTTHTVGGEFDFL